MSNSGTQNDDKRTAEWRKTAKERFEKNPCRKPPTYNGVEIEMRMTEQNLSLKCLDENYYDKEKCTSYFQNYKYCKAFWSYVSKERMKKGIRPHIPSPEDRESVKAEYLPSFRF